jgi:hypothetical protein
MPARKSPNKTEIYQLKITLRGSKPPIWRRVQVRSDINLATLHRIIQEAMGWTDSHLHQFRVGETYYGVPDQDDFGFSETEDEKTAKLNQLLSRPKAKFIYEPESTGKN